jgi:hypothetical protein
VSAWMLEVVVVVVVVGRHLPRPLESFLVLEIVVHSRTGDLKASSRSFRAECCWEAP